MENIQFLNKKEVSQLPHTPGVYAFQSREKLLYVGKATDIQQRVKSHFQKSNYRDNLFVEKVQKVGFIKTRSDIEALLLESQLIKKYNPKYNIMWRDDKRFFFVGITQEKLPRVFITHQPKRKGVKYIGPFVSGRPLKKALRALRKIFPYYTTKNHPKKPCPWCHLGLCPGPNPDTNEYQENIKKLVSVLKGKQKSVLKKMEKEMKETAKKQNYEKAAKLRDRKEALENIMAHARIIREFKKKEINWPKIERSLQKLLDIKRSLSRIEAYDISNIQGKEATGSMVTFIGGKPEKNLYRKFKIKKIKKPNDVGMIEEVLSRRFQHQEWGLPDIMLIDGGKAQLNTAIKAKDEKSETKNIKVVSLAKNKNNLYIEGRKDYVLLKNLPRDVSDLWLRLRDEAHRFAITYHKKLREKELFS